MLDDNINIPLAWTPDSREVIFSSQRAATRQIYRQALGQGSTAYPITSSPGLNFYMARPSPDGAWLVIEGEPSGPGASCQRGRIEGAELGSADRTGAIALDDAAVARLEVVAVENALVDQEGAPELVGIAVEERPVEVEQREPRRCHAQGLRRCQAFGLRKVWMP